MENNSEEIQFFKRIDSLIIANSETSLSLLRIFFWTIKKTCISNVAELDNTCRVNENESETQFLCHV